EVRSLAQRSAEAAKSTAGLLEQAHQEADEGVRAAAAVAELLNAIIQGISTVAERLNQIAAAGREQAAGITEVTASVAEMDSVTQMNAASAEQSASASEEMSAQAEQLLGVVATLSGLIEGRGQVAVAVRPPAPPAPPAPARPYRPTFHRNGKSPHEVIPLVESPAGF
ncbi:MAG: chemotaxis protein, partial [Armatimonadetes bacterium]|nr:chemotaxis protein [Armatimonadota bacterium]